MTNNRIVSIFFSKFMAWVVFAVLGMYFLFSIDKKAPALIEEQTGKKLSFWEKIYYSVKMPHLKLGIDLQGGTYVILNVEIDKAIENRLTSEAKTLEQLFQKQNLKVLPTKKEVADLNLNLYFPDEESAKTCYNLVKRESPTLRTTLKSEIVKVALAPADEQRIRVGSIEQAVNVLTNRLSGFGVEGIVVQQHGDHQVVVQLPGVDDPDRVRAIVTKTAHLDFKLVEKTAGSKQALLDDFAGELPADKVIVMGKHSGHEEEDGSGTAYLVSAYPDLSGEHIVDARVSYGEYNKVEVAFQLDSAGAKKFRELTGNNIGKHLGIIIDDLMITDPTIQSEISNSGRITGSRTLEEAKDLALVLRSGALMAPLKFEQESRVSASLGQDSINKGMLSCIVALLLIFIFSIFYYKIPGLFAVFTLLYNMFLILLFLSYFESSLTLPGIAGMVLTIGMAIDASILIYERTKEELHKGSPFRKAINDGFKGAMKVIFDANITNFLTGFVLFKFGGPAIKGFAVTLMVGIVATILSCVYFLKSIFDFVLDNTKIKEFKL